LLVLQLCKELLKQGYEVLGTCRSSSQELDQLPGVKVVTGGHARLAHWAALLAQSLLMG
jgi:nucleoside-diphosphate-sugar epimerase